jgi:glyoxylase-like metal-dependent hydrolase (beta-lactamase superfamily II)
MLERTMVVGPFQCNCRLIVCPKTGDAALIDPGDEAGRLVQAIGRERLPSGVPIRVKHLFHTHGHLDHIAATKEVRQALAGAAAGGTGTATGGAGAPKIWLHGDDEPLYKQLKMQGSLFGLTYDDPLPVDDYFKDGQELALGELKFTILHTPGHSPGSVCLRLHEDSGTQSKETVYSGDTLFAGSVGRTDLWGGDQDLMFKNIRTRLLTLDGDTRVCAGHGPDSSIGVEKRENPFLV